MRSLSQFLAYDISLLLSFFIISIFFKSIDLGKILLTQINFSSLSVLCLFPVFCCLIVIGFAETNRLPFDLPEAESELVAGYNVEYSSFLFSLFFLSEYNNMFVFSAVVSVIFFGPIMA
jgi:NADH-quinone oxidoreductase subunit H